MSQWFLAAFVQFDRCVYSMVLSRMLTHSNLLNLHAQALATRKEDNRIQAVFRGEEPMDS